MKVTVFTSRIKKCNCKQIIDYIKLEQAIEFEELNFDMILSFEALKNKGICLTNLRVVHQYIEKKYIEIVFATPRNYSKLRPGDSVIIFYSTTTKTNGTIIESQIESIIVRIHIKKKIDESKNWHVLLKSFFPNDGIINALQRLRRGYPGYGGHIIKILLMEFQKRR